MHIVLQPQTQQLVDSTIAQPAHGLLVSGPVGAGKVFAARHLAARILGVDDLAKYAHFRTISPAGNSISIDQIRDLQKFLQLTTPGTAGIRRAVIIEDAHLMTNEAQNALLKSLEEPPADTIIILTAPATLQLKETIYSRVQQIPILPITKRQAVEHFSAHAADAVGKNHMISGGYMGLLTALLTAEDHELAQQITTAKQLFGMSTYQRLCKVDELSKQKETLPLLLQACKLICSAGLHQATITNNPTKSSYWHRALETIYQAEAALPRNPNTKLLLTDVLVSL